ncbi:hypothetical protein XH92_23995 [Bradyrhizobium sp. CCBAU 53421]|nr:hypothetical protein XH92_23995 [Bradyrhizobium sp. CCBAU 53421]
MIRDQSLRPRLRWNRLEARRVRAEIPSVRCWWTEQTAISPAVLAKFALRSALPYAKGLTD